MNNYNQSGDFFLGTVKFISSGIISAKYYIASNNAIIKVNNAIHVRLIEPPVIVFPEAFRIIAPIGAVKCISGDIPDSCIMNLHASTYLDYRMKYQGF